MTFDETSWGDPRRWTVVLPDKKTGRITTIRGVGERTSRNITSIEESSPLAARRRERGLGARKRRMREARIKRAKMNQRQRYWGGR